MASAINDNFPSHGSPTTESVRDNFTVAKNEITNLQNQVQGIMLNMPYMPLAGATMTGPMMLMRPPVEPMEPATKAYVDALQTIIQQLDARITALETDPLSAATRR